MEILSFRILGDLFDWIFNYQTEVPRVSAVETGMGRIQNRGKSERILKIIIFLSLY